jgi:hypothetical protein
MQLSTDVALSAARHTDLIDVDIKYNVTLYLRELGIKD